MLIPCTECGRQLSPEAAVCPQCGHPQPLGDGLLCGLCRTPNSQDLSHCRGCGNDLSADVAQRAALEYEGAAHDKQRRFTF